MRDHINVRTMTTVHMQFVWLELWWKMSTTARNINFHTSGWTGGGGGSELSASNNTIVVPAKYCAMLWNVFLFLLFPALSSPAFRRLPAPFTTRFLPPWACLSPGVCPLINSIHKVTSKHTFLVFHLTFHFPLRLRL